MNAKLVSVALLPSVLAAFLVATFSLEILALFCVGSLPLASRKLLRHLQRNFSCPLIESFFSQSFRPFLAPLRLPPIAVVSAILTVPFSRVSAMLQTFPGLSSRSCVLSDVVL